MPLNNKWVSEEIKEGIKKYLETNENGSITESMGHSEHLSKWEIWSKEAYVKKQEKPQII